MKRKHWNTGSFLARIFLLLDSNYSWNHLISITVSVLVSTTFKTLAYLGWCCCSSVQTCMLARPAYCLVIMKTEWGHQTNKQIIHYSTGNSIHNIPFYYKVKNMYALKSIKYCFSVSFSLFYLRLYGGHISKWTEFSKSVQVLQ